MGLLNRRRREAATASARIAATPPVTSPMVNLARAGPYKLLSGRNTTRDQSLLWMGVWTMNSHSERPENFVRTLAVPGARLKNMFLALSQPSEFLSRSSANRLTRPRTMLRSG